MKEQEHTEGKAAEFQDNKKNGAKERLEETGRASEFQGKRETGTKERQYGKKGSGWKLEKEEEKKKEKEQLKGNGKGGRHTDRVSDAEMTRAKALAKEVLQLLHPSARREWQGRRQERGAPGTAREGEESVYLFQEEEGGGGVAAGRWL